MDHPFIDPRRAALLLGLLWIPAGCVADEDLALEGTSHGEDTTLAEPFAGDAPGVIDHGEAAPEQASSLYFYDLAEYMAPSCHTPVNLTFPDPNEIRRYVPVGVRHGAASWIYAKDTNKGFEEYTAGPAWIRLWSDTTWAYESIGQPGNFCDEICGAQGVQSGCFHEWANTPAPYAYLAPREANNTALGAKFMPRFIPRDDRNYSYSASVYLNANKRGDCQACPNNESWHSSALSPVTITAVVRHVPSYRGFNDLIMKATVAGSGRGDRFWYARGYGFVGFEQLSQSSSDMTSTDPAKAPISFDSFATGSNGQGSAFPGPDRACFGLSQAQNCGTWDPPMVIPLGQTISIRALANQKFVTAENAGGSALIANRPASGAWEKFTVVDQGNGTVALRAGANNRFVCADNGGQAALIANRPGTGQWETYRWIDLGNHDFALQSAANGKYVTAESGGAAPLVANRDDVGAWERFHWE